MVHLLQRTKTFLGELWQAHRAELIMVLTTIAFWIADIRASDTTVSPWAWAAVAVLLAYLLFILIDAGQTTNAVFGLVEVPYCIVTNKTIEEADLIVSSNLKALEDQGLAVGRVFDRFLISSSDWRYFDQNRAQDAMWLPLIRSIRDHFIRLSKRVTAQARFHLFFVTPPTIALALGAIIGRDIRCKAYQYFGPGGLVQVFDPERGGPTESYHRLQGAVGDYQEVVASVTGNASVKNVAIVLKLVGHPLSPVSAAISEPHRIVKVAHVRYDGHLPPTADWMRIATELGSLILREVSEGKTVHLFCGLPTSLAFALGHVLGDHNPIRVYYYDKEHDRYSYVYSLNQVM